MKIPWVLMFGLCAAVDCAPKNAVKGEIARTNKEQMVATELETKKPDYYSYIPVFESGIERNLYDLLEENTIVYFKRTDCKDCIAYGPEILSTLRNYENPVLEIETSKEPEAFSGLAIHSETVMAIGISEVPTIAFTKNRKFVARLENEFLQMDTLERMLKEIYP